MDDSERCNKFDLFIHKTITVITSIKQSFCLCHWIVLVSLHFEMK